MTLLESIAAVFCKKLEDWLGQPDEPFLHEIELPVDPTTIRQVLREALYRTKVRTWAGLELIFSKIEIHAPNTSHITLDDCAPEETPLPVQGLRFLNNLQGLCDDVERADLGMAFASIRHFLNKKCDGNEEAAGALMDAARNQSQTQNIVQACDSLIWNLRKTVGVDDSQISDLEDIRDAVKGDKPCTSSTQKTLFHDGDKDTRSGLVACMRHVIELAQRGWSVVGSNANYDTAACEVCEVGLDTSIKQAKGYRPTPDSGSALDGDGE